MSWLRSFWDWETRTGGHQQVGSMVLRWNRDYLSYATCYLDSWKCTWRLRSWMDRHWSVPFRSSSRIQSGTFKWLYLVLHLDRYCRKALRKAMKRFLSNNELDTIVAESLTALLSKPKPQNLDTLQEGFFPNRWIFRHKLPGDGLHIQSVSES